MTANHEDSSLASSFTDLMTSLAVIFILLLVAMMNNKELEAETRQSKTLSHFNKALRDFIKRGIEVKKDPTDPLVLLLYIPEDLLRFKQSKWKLPEKGRKFLDSFFIKFASTACSSELRPEISSIVVEGHASPEGDEKNNLRLSQKRSMEVLAHSLNVINESKNDETISAPLHKCFLDLVSASGRGSADSIYRSGIVRYEESRRVIFKIRIKSPDQILITN